MQWLFIIVIIVWATGGLPNTMERLRQARAGKGEMVKETWHQVVGYDWRSITVADVGALQPTRSVSVVIPAFDCQSQLDLTLAALACQRFPSTLLEVVVVDDGSTPPLVVPSPARGRTRIVRLDRAREWGRSRARHAGATSAEGEILLFLDADMVTHPDHVAAHARWHDKVREAVTLGHKLFVDFHGITSGDVSAAARDNRLAELVADRPQQEHEWVERFIERTDDLTAYVPNMFMAAVSSTVAMRAELYREVGGFRTHLRTGEDMEIGYRLMAAGAVFIPERGARSWHQGPATYMTRAAEVRRLNQPHFSNFVPVAGPFRPWTPGRQYAVPMTTVVVEIAPTYEATKACVDSVLASDETDLAVHVCGSAPEESLSLLNAEYAPDPRVALRSEVVETGFPSQYTMFLPPWAALHPESVTSMLAMLHKSQAGVLVVDVDGTDSAYGTVTLWRTAALHRARRAARDRQETLALATKMFGAVSATAGDLGVVDLRHDAAAQRPQRRPNLSEVLQRLARTQAELKALRRRHRRLRRRYEELARTAGGMEQINRYRRPSRVRVGTLPLQALRRLFSLW